VRRRTRVIRIFPNEASLVRLGTALAMERNEHWSLRRYLIPERPTIMYLHNGRPHYSRSA
jgi:transposase-like protein